MYNGVTEAFQSKLAEPSRTFQARLINTAKREEVISDGFFSIKSYAQSNENDETLALGGTASIYIEVELYQPVYMVTGKEYEYQIGLGLDDGTFEYVPIGQFTAQKPKDEDGKVTFTAYDRFVSRLGNLFTSELTYPADGKTILNEIQSKSGVSIANISSLPDGVLIPKRTSVSEADDNGNTSTTYVNPFDGFSYRETIGYLALLYGKFATINRNGAVELRWYTDSGYRVESNMSYDDIACAETAFEVKYVQCTIGDDSKNPLISGSGATGISANAPVMTQALLDGIYGKVGGMKYLPTTLTYQGDPRLELGDIITVVKRDGTEVKVPVMMLNLDFDGGLINEVGSYGDTEQTSEINNVGPATKRMDRVYSDLLLVKEVVASKASIAYLQANYANITELDAEKARIETLESNQVTTSYLKANFADITMANVDTAKINTGFLENLMVSQGIIADRVVGTKVVATDVLTGVNLFADDITAGTLSVDRLIFRGTEKSIVYELNSISGALQSASVDTLNGEIITQRSISPDRIVAKSITSNEINVTDLVSTGLIGANRITATNIKVTDLNALNAKIGGFDIGETCIYKGSNAIGTNNGAYFGNDGISVSDLFKVTPLDGLYLTDFGKTYSVSLKSVGMMIRNIGDINSYTSVNNIALGSAYYGINGAIAVTSMYITPSNDRTATSATILLQGAYNYINMHGESLCKITMGSDVDITYADRVLNIWAPRVNFRWGVQVGDFTNTSYALSTDSFICNSWIRTVGATGWYNETYGGGWWMQDSTYIRNFGNKQLLLDNTLYINSSNLYFTKANGVRSSTNSAWILREYDATNYNNLVSLGNTTYQVSIYTSGNVWKNGSSSTYFATTSTSDRRLKDYVSDMNEYEELFMDLKPIAFKYHEGLYNAPKKLPLIQWGFYAQDTVQAFEKHGISWSEQELVVIEDGELSAEEQKYVNGDMLKMNYQNLIALDTHMIQKTILKVDNQEDKIRELQIKLYDLQFAFEQLKLENEQLKQVVA